MLTETPHPGVLALRATTLDDMPEVRRRSIRALECGHRVVVIADRPGFAELVFAVRRTGPVLFVSTVKGCVERGSIPDAVAFGVGGARAAWERTP